MHILQNLYIGLVFASIITGCTDEGDAADYTWGQLSAEFGLVVCNSCGGTAEPELCAEHIRWHFCEPDMSCGVDLDRTEAENALAACAAAFEAATEQECFYLQYLGFTPTQCGGIFDLNPGPQEE